MSEVYLCRLCLEEASHLFDVYSAIGKKLRISEIVAQHLWFSIYENDELSNKICTVCWGKIQEFHTFYNSIQKAQDNITIIVDSKYTTEEVCDVVEEPVEIQLHDKICLDDEKVENVEEEELIEEHGEGELSDYKIETQLNQYFDEDNSSESETEVIELTVTNSSPNPNKTESNNSRNEEIEVEDVPDIPLSSAQTNFVKKRSQRLMNLKNWVNVNSDEVKKTINSCDNATEETNQTDHDDDDDDDDDDVEIELKKSPQCFTKTTKKPRKRKVDNSKIVEDEKTINDKIIESFFEIKCELCDDNLNKLHELLEHYPKKHGIRGFLLCCGKKFFKRKLLAEHVLFHQKPDLFKCQLCNNNKIYEDKRSLDNHNMVCHTSPDIKLYKCEHCDKTFIIKVKYDKHKLSHLAPEEKKYRCEDCEKPYASHGLLRAHIRVVHEKTYAHMCEICAKVFKSRAFFEKHQLEHMGKKLPKVQCQVCTAWLKNEHTMRAHMRLHQDEDVIHKCDVCGKVGPSRNAILKHKRFVHLSERKFKCNLCDKAFKRPITLKEHMSTHTGEILYSCTFCAKTFNSGANMHAHRKKAHPVEWKSDKMCKLNLLQAE